MTNQLLLTLMLLKMMIDHKFKCCSIIIFMGIYGNELQMYDKVIYSGASSYIQNLSNSNSINHKVSLGIDLLG